ncbi:hypothetical protein HN011_007726 [Eciton burchellii]|nr:hypothetical protein HN011_007726 [Eciton burchellii]
MLVVVVVVLDAGLWSWRLPCGKTTPAAGFPGRLPYCFYSPSASEMSGIGTLYALVRMSASRVDRQSSPTRASSVGFQATKNLLSIVRFCFLDRYSSSFVLFSISITSWNSSRLSLSCSNEQRTNVDLPIVFRLPPPQQQVTVGSLGGGLSGAGNGGTATVGAQGQAMVMPGFPLRAAAVPHYSPYSPSRFHIDKRCQHRCSWKCFSIALILVTVALMAMLAYFASE